MDGSKWGSLMEMSSWPLQPIMLGRRVMEYKGIPPFKATQLYVKKVFEYQQHYKK